MELFEYNKYFLEHFTMLKKERSKDYPVFAFEHGLDEDTINKLFEKVNSYKNPPSKLHRLVWIVCCTEIGYIYEGKEYWDTFNKKIPYLHLNYNGYKEELRDFFIWFEKTFNGIVPQGDWANYFVNISHPITHSIMPKQFQKLFVKDLDKYGKYADVDTIYQYMYFTCYSTRFKNFLENDRLAKLFLDSILNFENKNEIILKSSLNRIVRDLEEEDGNFNENINKIRKIYDTAKEDESQFKIEFLPNLYLKFDAEENFKLFFHLPSFLNIKQFLKLTNYRLRFTGSPALFRGDQLTNEGGNEVLLNKLPFGEEEFCYFLQIPAEQREDTNLNETFKEFMRTELKFLNEECLLFQVNEDGVAYYLMDKTLEIGKSYVVLSRTELSYTSNNNRIGYTFSGNFHLYKFTNDNYDELSKSFLRLCKISPSSKISFRTLGTIERGKNKNFFEYLVGESPLFFLEASNDIIRCEIRSEDETRNISFRDGKSFFELENLKQGLHEIKLTPYKKSPAGFDLPLDIIEKRILVRPPKLNVGFENKSLFFSTNQNELTLQNFWENKLDFQIFGPKQLNAQISFTLYDENDNVVIKKEILSGLSFPITKDIWIKNFEQIKSSLSKEYLISNSVIFEVQAFEVGYIFKKFENIQYPLRLLISNNNDETLIKIRNETSININDPSTIITFLFFSFEKPLFQNHLIKSPTDIENLNIKVEQTGGCFLIQLKNHDKIFSDIICVAQKSNKKALRGLEGLRQLQVQNIDLSDFTEIKYIGLFKVLDFWNRAKIVGESITYMKVKYIFDEILDKVYKEFYSISWYNSLSENKEYDLKLNALIRNLSVRLNSAKIINNKIQIQFKDQLEEVMNDSVDYGEMSYNYYNLCSKRNISQDPKLIAFSLHLAFEPLNLYHRYGKEISSLVPRLIQNSDLSRSSKILYYIYCIKKFNHYHKIPLGGYFD